MTISEFVAASRAAQGLPKHVVDPIVLSRVVALLLVSKDAGVGTKGVLAKEGGVS